MGMSASVLVCHLPAQMLGADLSIVHNPHPLNAQSHLLTFEIVYNCTIAVKWVNDIGELLVGVWVCSVINIGFL